MTYGQQPRNLGGTQWTDVPADDCTCKWVNYSDSTGFFLRSRDPGCPVHGNAGMPVKSEWR